MKSSIEIAQPWLTFEPEEMIHSNMLLSWSLLVALIFLAGAGAVWFLAKKFLKEHREQKQKKDWRL